MERGITRDARQDWQETKFTSAAALGTALLSLVAAPGAQAQAQTQINGTNWGRVTTPVYGTSEKLKANGTPTRLYRAAEIIAGPNKSSELLLPPGCRPTYYDGVLPNGKKVTPAGRLAQIGMHPLGSALTPDSIYLIVSCDDERGVSGGVSTLTSPTVAGGSVNLTGGYSITLLRTSDLKVAAQAVFGKLFIGLQVIPKPSHKYTIYASGGADQNVKVLTFTPPATAKAQGTLTAARPIVLKPITPNGSVTNFVMAATEGRKVWTLARKLDSSSPDRDSYRLSMVTLLSMQADTLHHAAQKNSTLHSAKYKAAQARIYKNAVKIVSGPKIGGDADGDAD